MFVAYLVENRVNGKRYVGISKSVKRRWRAHKYRAAGAGTSALHSAIKKYGIENFAFEVTACARSWDDLCELERVLIKQHGTLSPNGYNLRGGGEGPEGYVMPEHHKRKISVALTGMKRSPEQRANIAAGRKGIKLSKEAIGKRTASRAGYRWSEETRTTMVSKMTGRQFTSEWRARISKSLTGKKLSASHRAAISVGHKRRHNPKAEAQGELFP